MLPAFHSGGKERWRRSPPPVCFWSVMTAASSLARRFTSTAGPAITDPSDTTHHTSGTVTGGNNGRDGRGHAVTRRYRRAAGGAKSRRPAAGDPRVSRGD